MIELILWLLLLYIVYKVVKGLIRSAVNKGIRDYEIQKEAREKKEKEVKIDRGNIEDAHYEDLKKK